MPTGYRIYNQAGQYFLTFQVVNWIDVFSRKLYVDIIMESLDYCRKNKGLKVWAYVIMTNHMHVIFSSENETLSDTIRDFKRFTATNILKAIQENKYESRREWMLKQFEFAANKHKRNSKLQFWRHDNHAVELESYKFTMQKLAYIHDNPVRAGYVEEAEHWMHSSQRNYSGLHASIDIDMMEINCF